MARIRSKQKGFFFFKIAFSSSSVIISAVFFFISSNIIGMFIGYSLELSSRRIFYMRKLLQLEQEKVKSANSNLEKRVIERTQQLTNANLQLKKEIAAKGKS
jgi:C4-dicarboxylate-specific signal transduction histidine kinase